MQLDVFERFYDLHTEIESDVSNNNSRRRGLLPSLASQYHGKSFRFCIPHAVLDRSIPIIRNIAAPAAIAVVVHNKGSQSEKTGILTKASLKNNGRLERTCLADCVRLDPFLPWTRWPKLSRYAPASKLCTEPLGSYLTWIHFFIRLGSLIELAAERRKN